MSLVPLLLRFTVLILIFRNVCLLGVWSPFEIDLTCPIFAVDESDHLGGGFGDQFERYVHLLNVARLLKVTAVATFLPSEHSTGDEYTNIAQLMNINLNLSSQYKTFKIRNRVTVSSLNLNALHKEITINGRSPKLPCNTVILVDMKKDCGKDHWCAFVDQEMHKVKWILRNNSFVEHCSATGVGFQRKPGNVNVLWHIRTGDVCLHCNDGSYFKPMLSFIQAAINEKANMSLHFESMNDITKIARYFPHARMIAKQPLFHTICRILTADVFLTSGSSLGFVAIISKSSLPLIVEEKRKEADNPRARLTAPFFHVFNEDEAILMNNGKPVLSDWEIIYRIRATLIDLL